MKHTRGGIVSEEIFSNPQVISLKRVFVVNEPDYVYSVQRLVDSLQNSLFLQGKYNKSLSFRSWLSSNIRRNGFGLYFGPHVLYIINLSCLR